MKSGLTLEQLATELNRQNSAKEDYIVSTHSIKMESCGADLFLRMVDGEENDRVEPFELGPVAHRQIGSYLHIHSKYYNKMLEHAPALLAYNANHWFTHTPKERMVRTLDGVARAFVSNSYRFIDNFEIASAVLPVIGEMPDAHFVSCQITDNKMYIKVVNTNIVAEVFPGDTVQAGFVITNSETGQGAFSVQPLIYRLADGTGMVVGDEAIRRHHKGKVNSAARSFLIEKSETISADDRTFLTAVQEAVRSAADEDRFQQVVGMMRQAREAQINTTDLSAVVNLTAKSFSITESESGGVLQHLVQGNDLTLYGLSNAVTRFSGDVESYDRASELETIGYDVLSMGRSQWNRLNQAA